jgi:7-keto-8-aminopelargonate synthetase-like enzyme
MSDQINKPLRRYRNTEKMLTFSSENWEMAEQHELINFFATTAADGKFSRTDLDIEFVNMSSYSYLGLNRHPDIIRGGIEALEQEQFVCMGITPTRIKPALMDRAQKEMSELFNAQCLLSISCTVATAGFLPLISSGYLFDKQPRVMAFDKKCHFCMDMMKPICADETHVEICPHNDMNYLEDLCKKHPRVAYIADGAYSMGGVANTEAISMMQDKYGLVVWYDDSHSLSVTGKYGEGYVKEKIGELNPLTLITASLEKGFGCAGGVVMLSKEHDQSFLNFATGPMCWSQTMSVANLGFILASIKLHRSEEYRKLQNQLRNNIAYFDEKMPTKFAGNLLPVRAVVIGDRDKSISISRNLLDKGYYVSPVYFPVTSRGNEGLRVMIRSDMNQEDLKKFCELLNSEIEVINIEETN